MSKTATYAFLRFCIPLFPQAAQQLAPVLSIMAIVGILYCAVLALVQNDIKRLLGYSSISHLGVITLGIFVFNLQGVEGALMQMVNHGITTAALFLIAGYLEAKTGTRRLSDLGGLALKMPVMAVMMAIAALSSLGLPGLNSFAGEFVTLIGVFNANQVYGALATAVVVPAAWYMLRFFQGIMEGPKPQDPIGTRRWNFMTDILQYEFLSVVPLLALIFILGLFPQPLIFLVERSVISVMQVVGVR
jgi:NADH-quinone oxidoreductase subunit M